jgi:predicted nucleic acid-binding protein
MAARYFADTFYWIALANPADAWHARVSAWRQAHPAAPLVTTEEVLSEVLTWFAGTGPAGRAHAAATVRDILADPSTRVLPQTSGDFLAALALDEARPDKGYSLTDCRSMNALRGHGITDVLTSDHHFTQEGFTVLFPGP